MLMCDMPIKSPSSKLKAKVLKPFEFFKYALFSSVSSSLIIELGFYRDGVLSTWEIATWGYRHGVYRVGVHPAATHAIGGYMLYERSMHLRRRRKSRQDKLKMDLIFFVNFTPV